MTVYDYEIMKEKNGFIPKKFPKLGGKKFIDLGEEASE